MNILLIQPKMNKRPMDTELKTRMAPSMALLTLAALTPENHTVTIVNENTEPLQIRAGYDLVAITVTVDVMPRAIEISEAFRKINTPVIAGGPHISAVPQQAQGHFTSLCIGMAERVWQTVLADREKNEMKPVYQNMCDIKGDEITPPAYHTLDNRRYLYTNIISASRYCPFQCDFCYNSSPAGLGRHLTRPIEDVLREIRMLKTDHIMFIDDNFIGDIHWTRAFLKELRPLGIRWNAAVSVNLVDHLDLLDLMQESGCLSLFIGFETINQAAITGVHKKQNQVSRYERLIQEIHKRDIMVNASLVFGLPGDTAAVFDDTLEWLIRNKVETATSHILTPYPGTVLYEQMEKNRQIVDADLTHYNTAHVVFSPQGMSAQALQDGYLLFYKKFYSFKSIFKRLPDSRSQRTAYLLFNIFYRKYGKLIQAISRIIPLHSLGKLAAKMAYGVSYRSPAPATPSLDIKEPIPYP